MPYAQFYEDNVPETERKIDQETRVRNANFQIPDDIKLVENIPYLNDSCPAHTMDIYRPASLVPSRPVIINVHGGGLMEGSKEFNRRFCIQLCRQNFVVFSIEYRLIPDVTVYEQLDDVSRAMDAVKSLIIRYQGNPNQVYMIGDSAGAYLIAYAVAMQNSPELAGAAHVHPSSLPIQALGLISGMFYTRKLDKIGLFLPRFDTVPAIAKLHLLPIPIRNILRLRKTCLHAIWLPARMICSNIIH